MRSFGSICANQFASIAEREIRQTNSRKVSSMSRTAAMTIGLVLIFIGVQLFMVKSYLLTPTATRFVEENFQNNNGSQFASGNNSGGLFQSNKNSGGLFGDNGANQRSGELASYPGQSWPYYNTNQSGQRAGNGSVFQNSTYNPPSSFASSSSKVILGNGQQRRFVPPRWIMWPALCLGAISFLHGVALRS